MRFSSLKDLTKIEHSLFGIPFVLGGALLSLIQPTLSVRWISWLWIMPAFLLARTAGMAFNRLIDRHIDASNPRTKNRALPAGRVSVKEARLIAWGSLALFVLVCAQINVLTGFLSAIAALLLYVYGYMKRIHSSCHFVLGMIHFLGPVMAYAALTGRCSWAVLFLGGVAFLVIGGNDVVYAIQDYEFDCKQNLFSLPSRLGIRKSLSIAFWMHFFCLLMLLGLGLSAHLPWIYYFVLPVVATILFYFHYHLRQQYASEQGLQGLESAFFLCNVAVLFSVLFFMLCGIVWVVLL